VEIQKTLEGKDDELRLKGIPNSLTWEARKHRSRLHESGTAGLFYSRVGKKVGLRDITGEKPYQL